VKVTKVPYMLIVGEKEAAESKVAVRKHGSGDQGVMGLEEFAAKFAEECAVPS
jgi:threonyl-tRNA synthetase